MPKMAILSRARITAFDEGVTVPKSKMTDYLVPDTQRKQFLNTLSKPENRVCYQLLDVNFKLKAKFPPVHKLSKKNKLFLERHLDLPSLDLSKVSPSSLSYYKQKILAFYGWSEFKPEDREGLVNLAVLAVDKQSNREDVLFMLTTHLTNIKKEIPSYRQLADIVGEAFKQFDEKMTSLIKSHMTPYQRSELFSLIHDEEISFSSLKKINQGQRQKDLLEAGGELGIFKKVFLAVEPLLHKIEFTPEAVKSYSNSLEIKTIDWIRKLKDENQLALMLCAFVYDQFNKRQDIGLTQIVRYIKAESNELRNKQRKEKEENEKEVEGANQAVLDTMDSFLGAMSKIIEIADDPGRDSDKKVQDVRHLAKSYTFAEAPELESLHTKFAEHVNNFKLRSGVNHLLFKRARSLKKSIFPILRHLIFDKTYSDKDIYEAVTYYIAAEGEAEVDSAPIDFLSDIDRHLLFHEETGDFSSRYGVLIFVYLQSAFNRRRIYLKYSYNHRPIDVDLLSKDLFDKKYDEYLKLYQLKEYEDCDKWLERIGKEVNALFDLVTELDKAGTNPQLKINNDGSWYLSPDAADFDDSKFIPKILENKQIALYELLAEVEKITGFRKCFKKRPQRHVKRAEAPIKSLLAVAISLGTNTGHNDLAKQSTGITLKMLRDTERDFFNNENIKAANDIIIREISNFALSTIYYFKDDVIFTASDGQKLVVEADSVLSNHSFKYFGKAKGVVLNRLLDETQAFIHGNVIAGGEREAHSMVDAVMKSKRMLFGDGESEKNPKKHQHASDTHGFTNATFGVLFLDSVAFAPRLANMPRLTLLAYENKYKDGNTTNRIAPKSTVRKNLIRKNWKDILRLMATLKSGTVSASNLLKKLHARGNSCEFFEALKEFGSLLKTQHILKMITDEQTRRYVQKMQNRVELGNKLSKAVFHGQNGTLRVSTDEEMERIMLCKHLLINALILWNYISLHDYYYQLEDEEEKRQAILSMQRGSVLAWRHVNKGGRLNWDELNVNSFATPINVLKNIQLVDYNSEKDKNSS